MTAPEEPCELSLSVRSFVAPLERSGSLDARLASLADEDPQSLGARTHARIQKRLLREDPRNQSEVPVRAVLERPGFRCLVRGRIDLLLAEDTVPLALGARPRYVLDGIERGGVRSVELT